MINSVPRGTKLISNERRWVRSRTDLAVLRKAKYHYRRNWGQSLTVADLEKKLSLNPPKADQYVRRLVQGGYLDKCGGPHHNANHFHWNKKLNSINVDLLGSKLREIREKMGWTQQEMAKVMGYGQTVSYGIIENSHSNPSREALLVLCNKMNWPVELRRKMFLLDYQVYDVFDGQVITLPQPPKAKKTNPLKRLFRKLAYKNL